MDEITKAYIAGFFDGEGCVYLGWHARTELTKKKGYIVYPHYTTVNLIVTNTDLEIINYLHQTLNAGNIHTRNNDSPCRKQHWSHTSELRIDNFTDISRVVADILPYSHIKTAQLLIIKETVDYFIEMKKTEPRQWSKETLTFFGQQVTKLSKLKNNGRLVPIPGRPRIKRT